MVFLGLVPLTFMLDLTAILLLYVSKVSEAESSRIHSYFNGGSIRASSGMNVMSMGYLEVN